MAYLEMYSEEELTAKPNNDHCYLKGVVDHFEKNQAIIKLTDGQEIRWPVDRLADGLQESGVIKLILKTTADDASETQATARAILNQILKIEVKE